MWRGCYTEVDETGGSTSLPPWAIALIVGCSIVLIAAAVTIGCYVVKM